jgi:hypothetical protein
MATAVALASIVDERYTWVAGNKYYVIGNVAISVSPATYVTGGIPMNLFLPLVKATFAPILVRVIGQGAGTTGTLFVYVYIPGADASAGLLKIFTTGAATQDGLAELTNGSAIPADVSGDTITFEAIFNGML